jgi:hypothetical protein
MRGGIAGLLVVVLGTLLAAAGIVLFAGAGESEMPALAMLMGAAAFLGAAAAKVRRTERRAAEVASAEIIPFPARPAAKKVYQ